MLQSLGSKVLHCVVSHRDWQTCKSLLGNGIFLCLDLTATRASVQKGHQAVGRSFGLRERPLGDEVAEL